MERLTSPRSSVDDAVVDGHDERVEVGEALVEVPRVEAGRLAHRPHGRARPALGAEQLEGGVEEQAAALGPPVIGGETGPASRGCGARRDLSTGVTVTYGRSWQRPLPMTAARADGRRGSSGSSGRSGTRQVVVIGGGGSAGSAPRWRSAGPATRCSCSSAIRCPRPATPRRRSPPSGAAPRRSTRPTASSPASSSSCAEHFPDVLAGAAATSGASRCRPATTSASRSPATRTWRC